MATLAMPHTRPPVVRLRQKPESGRSGGLDGEGRLGIRWAGPAGFHLTLKFLGNVPEKRLFEIVDGVSRVIPSFSPFTVHVGGLGLFPNTRSPRVIWIGVRSVGDDLVRLQKGIEGALEPLGFVCEDRSFRPHLTLCRLSSSGKRPVPSPGGGDLVKWLAQNEQRECGTFEVKEVLLVKSDLKPSGAVYTTLATMGLAVPS